MNDSQLPSPMMPDPLNGMQLTTFNTSDTTTDLRSNQLLKRKGKKVKKGTKKRQR